MSQVNISISLLNLQNKRPGVGVEMDSGHCTLLTPLKHGEYISVREKLGVDALIAIRQTRRGCPYSQLARSQLAIYGHLDMGLKRRYFIVVSRRTFEMER